MNAAHDAAMNFTKNIGMLLLAVYLIVVGIIGLTGIGPGVMLPILALIAGIFILIRPRLLNYIVAIYLIFVGLVGLGVLKMFRF